MCKPRSWPCSGEVGRSKHGSACSVQILNTVSKFRYGVFLSAAGPIFCIRNKMFQMFCVVWFQFIADSIFSCLANLIPVFLCLLGKKIPNEDLRKALSVEG